MNTDDILIFYRGINLETEQQEEPSQQFWLAVARSVQLSPLQLRAAAAAADAHEPRMQELHARRQTLSQQMVSWTGLQHQGPAGGAADSDGHVAGVGGNGPMAELSMRLANLNALRQVTQDLYEAVKAETASNW